MGSYKWRWFPSAKYAQGILQTDDDLVHWIIYASPGLNELNLELLHYPWYLISHFECSGAISCNQVPNGLHAECSFHLMKAFTG